MKRCVKSLLLVALIGFVPLVMAQSPTEDATQTPVQTVIEGSKAAGSAVIETSRETVRGAAEAGSEFGGAVKSGTQTVVGQTKSLWRETVGPALERTSGALPSLIKAVILLIAFWIAALVVGSATTKILKITKLDNKAAKDLGLEKLLQKPDGTQRSLESLAGKLVKWLILLFGFVAFFNALNLQMVAGPLQNIIDKADFDVARIDEIELTTKHDIIAFLTNVAEYVGPSSRWIHYGMTSSDVLDTATALQCKQAGNLILAELKVFAESLRKQAIKYKDVVCIGRSHGIHAEPTSFGLKFTLWFDEMNRNIKRMERAIEAVSVGQISGAVGNYAHLAPEIEELACKHLELKPVNRPHCYSSA